MNKYTLLLALCFIGLPCFGVEVENIRTITNLAAESGNRGYFRVAEPLNVSCKYSVVYFDLNTDAGKAHYTLLLAAKMSNKKLSTLAYNFNADTTCTLLTVEID